MKIRPIFKTIDIFSFIQFLSRQINYIIKFFLLKVLYLVYHKGITEIEIIKSFIESSTDSFILLLGFLNFNIPVAQNTVTTI